MRRGNARRFDLLVSMSPEELARREQLTPEMREELLREGLSAREEAEKDTPHPVVSARLRFR